MSSSPPITDLTKYRTLANADLVMKGGITSGVVYPKAVVRVARDYRIHNIGGTSVGAIAAALTASAEYWRRTQPDNVSSRQQDQIDAIVTALDAGDADGKSGWDNPGRDDVVQAEAALTTGEHGNRATPGSTGFPRRSAPTCSASSGPPPAPAAPSSSSSPGWRRPPRRPGRSPPSPASSTWCARSRRCWSPSWRWPSSASRSWGWCRWACWPSPARAASCATGWRRR